MCVCVCVRKWWLIVKVFGTRAAVYVNWMQRLWCKLTGTLGSDTAMLSGYTVAFTHWLSVAAKRYGSSARSHRLLWEQLGWR